jgi:drug/metabolite transporter (DMT)-like permease
VRRPDDEFVVAPAKIRVDALLILVAVVWGSTYLTAKDLLDPEAVIALLAARMVVATAVMAVVVLVRRGSISWAELRAGVIVGLVLTAVFAFETFGIDNTSATNAGLIISLTIVFTPLLDSVVSRRRLPGRFHLAATMAIVGVAALAGDGGLRTPGVGDLLVLGAAATRAVHVVAMHRLTRAAPMDSIHLTTIQLGTCAAVFGGVSSFYGESVPHYVDRLTPVEILLFMYLAVICTVFAFLVQMWAVRRTSPARVSLLLGTEPVWAAIIGITLAHDQIGPAGLTGIAFIFAGTQWGRALEQRHHVRPRRRASERSLQGRSEAAGPSSGRSRPTRVHLPD